MTLFIISVAVVLVVSAFCSLTEAAIYAVRRPYVRQLAESGNLSGKVLMGFKDNMERPISAILIVNTAANTAGAAIAGTQAAKVFGDSQNVLVFFTVSFTVAVLLFSEIIPKVVGVVYSRPVSRLVAVPWHVTIAGMLPVIWLIQRMTQLLKPSDPIMAAPEEEVQQMAQISAEEGSILEVEAELVQNVLRLNDLHARDIMTPRQVAFALKADMTLREVAKVVREWTFSRIPIYDPNNPEEWTGVVLSQDILTRLAADNFDVTLQTLSKPMHFVPDRAPGHVLLSEFIQRRTHLFGVVDEYGSVVGVVTLEDVLESLIGEEIVDEVDKAVDLQEVARRRRGKRQ